MARPQTPNPPHPPAPSTDVALTKIGRALEQARAEFGGSTSVRRVQALIVIGMRGPSNYLAAATALDANDETTLRNLEALAAEGMLEQRAGTREARGKPADRRKVSWALTGKGAAVLSRLSVRVDD